MTRRHHTANTSAQHLETKTASTNRWTPTTNYHSVTLRRVVHQVVKKKTVTKLTFYTTTLFTL